MKHLNLEITDCTDCPYMDTFYFEYSDAWCCKTEEDIENVKVIPSWCPLPSTKDEREHRCGGNCGE